MNRFLILPIAFFGFQIQVNAQCVASIQAPSQAISNCTGPQVSVVASGLGPYQYSWSSPSLTIQPQTGASPTVSTNTPGWHTLNVVVVDSNNCTSVATDSIQFFPPVATFTQTYCTLPDSVCILDCPMLVQGWTYTDNQGSTSNLPLTPCVSIVGPGSYELFGIYDMNCTAIHTYLVSQDCGSGSGCTASIQAPSQAISNCTGPQATATASGPGPYQYSWTSPTLNIVSPTSATTILSANSPGWHTINVNVVDSNNCTALATDSIEFFLPVDTFTQTYCTLPDSVCILDCPMLVQGWTYTDNQNNTINLPLTPCVSIVGPGSYKVFGIYDMNCTAVHTYLVAEDCGGVSILEQIDWEIEAFPNPFSESIVLRMGGNRARTWELLDVYGRVVNRGEAKTDLEKIETTDLPSGVYLLHVSDGERRKSYRMVK
jgi:hypothetical protein